MASSFAVQSPADVLNLALRRIGYKLRVGTLYDGSMAGKMALDVYAQTRDELLRSGAGPDSEWPFAGRTVAGTLLKSAPMTITGAGYFPPVTWNPATNPPPPWLYEYQWNADFLKIRAVKPTPLFIPNMAPQPNLFAVMNDNAFNPPQRVVCCNVASALIVYTGQVTDPNTWPNDFTSALADALGEALAPILANPEMLKAIVAEEAQAVGGAVAQQG